MLFVTGRCGAGCYYCPLSHRKRGRQVVYANEMRVRDDSDILREARLIRATGTGITGGDPLVQPEETARLIKLLKENFGERHHIHLYTASANIAAIGVVSELGLDEIRFHPPWQSWGRIEKTPFPKTFAYSKGLGLDVGMEIPSLPAARAETLHLLEIADRCEVSFMNINELEFSYTNWRALGRRGFDVKNEVSNAAKGSEELALSLLEEAPTGLSVHYCSASFKNSVQLRRRIARRARSIKRPLDIITEDGTLEMGIVEARNPERIADILAERFDIPKRYLEVNRGMNRVEIAPWILREIAGELEFDSFIIEEYPTADRLEVERERLSIRRR